MNNVITETYPSTGGPHTVRSTYQSGWTAEEWQADLDAKVDAAQADGYPLVVPT